MMELEPDVAAMMGSYGQIVPIANWDGESEIPFTIYGNNETIRKLDEKLLPESVDGVIIRSSTEGSTKKFKLTVDDNGTITATEI